MKMYNRFPVFLLLVAGLIGLPACDSTGLEAQFLFGSWTVTDLSDSSGSRWDDVVAEVGGMNMEFQNDGDLIVAVDEPTDPDSEPFDFEANYQVIAFSDQIVVNADFGGGVIAYIFTVNTETNNRMRLTADSDAAEFIVNFFSDAGTSLDFSGSVSLTLQRNASE